MYALAVRECNLIRTVPNQRCLAFKYFNFKFCMRVIKICCHFLLFDRVGFHYFIWSLSNYVFSDHYSIYVILIESPNRNNWFDLKWINISVYIYILFWFGCFSALDVSFPIFFFFLSLSLFCLLPPESFVDEVKRYIFKLDIIKMLKKTTKWQNNYHKLMIEQNTQNKMT